MMDSKGNQQGVKRKFGTDSTVLKDAPRELFVVEFAQSRAAEIKALQKQINESKGNRLVMQLLPKGLRRRALSHNIKRLPRRLREAAKKDYKDRDTKARRKPPSRKYRRRPKNLLEEYNRRQRKHVWLETHIWHAKRFHMAEKWGYRIPFKPTDKSARAAYRATQHHCLIQDISYMCCIECRGPEETILEGLSHMTDAATGQTFAAKGCLTGTREGQTMLYSCDTYPYKAITCSSFLWQPLTCNNAQSPSERRLWLCVHPACHDEVCQELEKSFKLSNDRNDKLETGTELSGHSVKKQHVISQGYKDTDKKESKIETADVGENSGTSDLSEPVKSVLESKKVPTPQSQQHEKVIKNWKCAIGEVVLESLKDCLVRFRLIGPASQAVLSQSLQVADVLPQDESQNLWWSKFYSNEDMAIGHTQQREFWDRAAKCRSPGELTPHMILGLTVRDPRLLMPDIRTKALESQQLDTDQSLSEAASPDMSASAIWDPLVRSEVKLTKLTDHQLNQIKAEHLIPGTPLELGEKESKIPIILIQNPGVRSVTKCQQRRAAQSYGSGWDIILPVGWSMAFWVAFNYRCARAGGLKESQCLAHEQGVLHFPEGFPDTAVGKKEEKEICVQLSETFNKKPPAKRPNFAKFGIKYPFQFPWKILVKQWVEKEVSQDITSHSEFFVLRDKKTLKILSTVFSDVTTRKSSVEDPSNLFTAAESKLCKYEHLKSVGNTFYNCLVAVEVSMVTRGCPEQFGNICIPTQEDLTKLVSTPDYGGPTEPIHRDSAEQKKRQIKNKRQKLDSSGKNNVTGKEGLDRTGNANKAAVCDIENCENLIDCCSRQVIGYLIGGGFVLGSGNGRGVGFCSLTGLLKLLKSTPSKLPCTVLVRNPTTFQYRYTNISILL